MRTQQDLIKNTDWDVLLIIDACRYDYFEKYHSYILRGELTKTVSPATWSYGWLAETFKEPIDATFISSDYEINSKGIRDEKIYDWKKRKQNVSFDARDYFKEIIDVWEYGVNRDIGLVHPSRVCKEIDLYLQSNPETRVISQFWQLHDPYLYYILSDSYPVVDMTDINHRNKRVYRWVNLKRNISRFLSDESLWSLQKQLGKTPKSGLALLWSKYGRHGIQIGYKEDLLLTLRCIKGLAKKYPDKSFVVTSDHGELLGEHGRYGHTANKRYRELTEVPWFIIPRGKL